MIEHVCNINTIHRDEMKNSTAINGIADIKNYDDATERYKNV